MDSRPRVNSDANNWREYACRQLPNRSLVIFVSFVVDWSVNSRPMSNASIVSIHPYFKVQEGKLEEFKSLLPEFVARTSTEEGCLYYHFTINDDVVFCREAYVDGDAALAHLDNVGPILEKAMGLAELIRLELHGGEAELAKLREPLGGLNPQWFVFQDGVES